MTVTNLRIVGALLLALLSLAACTKDRSLKAVGAPTPTAPASTATVVPMLSQTGTPASGPVVSPKGRLRLDPDHGACGRFVTVRGDGFQPDATVQLTRLVDSPHQGGRGIIIPQDGVFTARVVIEYPLCQEGQQFRIVAKDIRTPRTPEELALVQQPDPVAVYTVTISTPPPTISLSPSSGPCDSTLELTGGGLAPHVKKVQAGLFPGMGSDYPKVMLGTATVDHGAFRMQVTLGLDGCDSASEGVRRGGTTLVELHISIYDATERPLLVIGGVKYKPTTGEATPESGAHRNPKFTDRICCI